jgi:hypothetical protein
VLLMYLAKELKGGYALVVRCVFSWIFEVLFAAAATAAAVVPLLS